MRKAVLNIVALALLAGCQAASQSGSGGGKLEGSGEPVTRLDGYTGTWQVNSFGGGTQIDIKPVDGRYLGYADRSINGQTVATVETRLADGRIYMDWDIDERVERAPDITAECDVVTPQEELSCTGWAMQGRSRWRKVSDDYLVEARTGKSVEAAFAGNVAAGGIGTTSGQLGSLDPVEIAGLSPGVSSCGYAAGPEAASVYGEARSAVGNMSAYPSSLGEAVAGAEARGFICAEGRAVLSQRIASSRQTIAGWQAVTRPGTPLRFSCETAMNPSMEGTRTCNLANIMQELVLTAELCRRNC